MTTVLGLEVVEEVPHHPTLRFLLDGTESLCGVDGHTERNRVADVLDTDALVPRAWPHRVALYGCGCGVFACSTLTALISDDGRDVVWSDFRTVLTADFEAALPDHPDPDPARDPECHSRVLDLTDVRFVRWQYEDALNAARGDLRWESRPRSVARLLRETGAWDDRSWMVLAPWRSGDDSDAVHEMVWVDVLADGEWRMWALPVGDGTAADAAARLGGLLADREPSEVPGARPVFA